MARGGGSGMRGLGIDIKSSFVVKHRIPEVRAKLIAEATQRSKDVAEAMYDILVEEMFNTPPGGELYPFDKKNWASGVHEASMPGEYPAVWWEDFMRSIELVPFEYDRSRGYAIGSDSEVGVHLEFGTWKMEPRPWLTKIYREGIKIGQKVFLRQFERL